MSSANKFFAGVLATLITASIIGWVSSVENRFAERMILITDLRLMMQETRDDVKHIREKLDQNE